MSKTQTKKITNGYQADLKLKLLDKRVNHSFMNATFLLGQSCQDKFDVFMRGLHQR